MPRKLTFRCSNAVADKIDQALAVRSSGLFLLPPRDEDTDPRAALLEAIVSDWMRNLTPEGLSKARIVSTGYMQEMAAPLRPMFRDVELPPIASPNESAEVGPNSLEPTMPADGIVGGPSPRRQRFPRSATTDAIV